jgi:hypothetical protein
MRSKAITVLIAAGLAGACGPGSQPPAAPDTITLPVQVSAGGAASTSANAASGHNHAHMTGAQEVPARDTLAQGQTTFKISSDGESISYKLSVANIENVLQSHIHRAAAGTNGGIVVWLYPSAPPAQLIPGRSQGVLAEGVITASSLMGTLAGEPLSVLIDEMRAGNTYVNVHTSQFPPGEIRGQIE